MEVVAFLERPVELLGEGCCDRGLPAARYAGDNEDCAIVSEGMTRTLLSGYRDRSLQPWLIRSSRRLRRRDC